MLGIIYSLKDFMQRVSPTDCKEPFVSYKTNKVKVHYYETPSGIVFVLTTDPSVGDIRNILQDLHKTVMKSLQSFSFMVKSTVKDTS